MKNFKTYLEEAAGKGLTIFDIDETMFITKAQVHVVKNGKVIKKLDNQEFNTYKKKSGEEFDFGEFKNAEVFQRTSTPIARMINKVKAILKNATKAGSKVIIVTARPNFDNKKTFLDTFRKQGIDIDKIYIERAGNLGTGPAADNKKIIFKKYLDQNIYKRIRLFDDAKSNLKIFLSLQKDYPDVSFEAFLAKPTGSVSRVR
mgnify:FL=1|jgi:hypothetical protein|tara:strand:+ start:788 stop:1393 length:606 start_codon:yes stop_codon:yes gene_type:complete